MKVLVSRKESIRLAAITPSHLRALIANGRLIEEDALIDGVVRKGVRWKASRPISAGRRVSWPTC